jgi:hypothetical protein
MLEYKYKGEYVKECTKIKNGKCIINWNYYNNINKFVYHVSVDGPNDEDKYELLVKINEERTYYTCDKRKIKDELKKLKINKTLFPSFLIERSSQSDNTDGLKKYTNTKHKQINSKYVLEKCSKF